MTKVKKKQVLVYLTEKENDFLASESAEQGVSKTAYVRLLINEAMNSRKQKKVFG